MTVLKITAGEPAGSVLGLANQNVRVSTMKRILALLPLTLLLAACSTHLQQKEQFLREAGFRTVTPSTPAQIAHVQSLPQGHITHLTHKGKTLYVLADARYNLLLVGNDAQFQTYQQLLYSKKITPEKNQEKIIQEDNEAWGPGGFYGPYYGPYYGPMMIY
jgi:hypothetical protein